MIINTGFGIGAAVLMFFSRLGSSYEMVIAGRCLVGFNCGQYKELKRMKYKYIVLYVTRYKILGPNKALHDSKKNDMKV